MKIKNILLSIIIFSNVAFAKDNTETLSHAVGQMMMVGFNGTKVDESSVIVKEIKQYHIAA